MRAEGDDSVSDVALAADEARVSSFRSTRWLSRIASTAPRPLALSSMVAGSALALADEDGDKARRTTRPHALEETDDGTILSGVAFPDLGAARDRASRRAPPPSSPGEGRLRRRRKAAEKEGGFFLHEGRWVVSQRAGSAPPGALVHGASRTGRTQHGVRIGRRAHAHAHAERWRAAARAPCAPRRPRH